MKKNITEIKVGDEILLDKKDFDSGYWMPYIVIEVKNIYAQRLRNSKVDWRIVEFTVDGYNYAAKFTTRKSFEWRGRAQKETN